MSKRIFYSTIIFIFLTQISPLITETPKFFCKNLGNGMIECASLEFSERFFFTIRLCIIIAAVFLYALIQYYQTYKPLKKYSSAQKEVFDFILAPTLDHYNSEGISIRINVMKAHRFLGFMSFIQKLKPVYHHGFEAKHRDSQLSFWVIKVFWWKWAQGNCGLSFVEESPQLADLTEGIPYHYRLSKNKEKKTEYIKGIISIPVFEVFRDNSSSDIIGVINIDTNDESLVKKWVEEEECLKSIVNKFENHAKIVSYFI